jgi:hypothetical protein
MILSTALNMMIDKTECIIFLNTPDSICAETAIHKPRTYSPWIYSEIAMTQLIRKKTLEEHRGLVKKAAQLLSEEQLRIKYDVDLSHLKDIDDNVLKEWERRAKLLPKENLLDVLYELCP